jgi:Transcription factor WhiB
MHRSAPKRGPVHLRPIEATTAVKPKNPSKMLDDWTRSTRDMSWQDRANCRENESAYYAMFSDSRIDRDKAREDFCTHCPVKVECGLFAGESKSIGVWGGEYITPAQARESYVGNGEVLTKERHTALRDRVVYLYESGLTQERVAQIVNKHPATVWGLLKQAGVKGRVRTTKAQRAKAAEEAKRASQVDN